MLSKQSYSIQKPNINRHFLGRGGRGSSSCSGPSFRFHVAVSFVASCGVDCPLTTTISLRVTHGDSKLGLALKRIRSACGRAGGPAGVWTCLRAVFRIPSKGLRENIKRFDLFLSLATWHGFPLTILPWLWGTNGNDSQKANCIKLSGAFRMGI